MANYGPQQYFCSPQGSSPVKTKRIWISRVLRTSGRLARTALAVVLLASAGRAVAQQSQTVDSIRVIGNRRIPKETVLARLFTNPATSSTRSPSSAISTRFGTPATLKTCASSRNSEKGIILDIFVKEKPTIREINYKGLNAVSQSDIIFIGEGMGGCTGDDKFFVYLNMDFSKKRSKSHNGLEYMIE